MLIGRVPPRETVSRLGARSVPRRTIGPTDDEERARVNGRSMSRKILESRSVLHVVKKNQYWHSRLIEGTEMACMSGVENAEETTTVKQGDRES